MPSFNTAVVQPSALQCTVWKILYYCTKLHCFANLTFEHTTENCSQYNMQHCSDCMALHCTGTQYINKLEYSAVECKTVHFH